MNYPYRFFRLAYSVILENYVTQLSMYEQVLPSQERAKLRANNEKLISRNVLKGLKVSFEDPVEQQWADRGIPIGPSYSKITYSDYFDISRYKGIIGKSIELCSEMYDQDEEEDYAVDDDDDNYRYIRDKISVELRKYTKSGDCIKYHRGNIALREDFVLKFIQFAIEVLERKVTLTHEDLMSKKNLEAIKNEFNHFILSQKLGTKSLHSQIQTEHNRFWQSRPVLKKFFDSKFLCYQRTDACKNKEAKFGISISPIEIIRSDKNDCTIKMESKFFDEDGTSQGYEYSGLITYDETTDYLIAEIKRHATDSIPTSPAYFFMRVEDGPNIQLLLGYHVYFSLRSKRFIVKSVIWSKFGASMEGDKLKSFSEKKISDYMVDWNEIDDRDNFLSIPMEIRRYLADRKLNRLTMPEMGINQISHSETGLSQWLKYQNKAAEDKILRACCTKYYVFYYYGIDKLEHLDDKEILRTIRVDLLEISFDENNISYEAIFTHKRETEAVYQGCAKRKQATIEIVVEENPSKYKAFESNTVFLSFSVPNAEQSFKTEFDKINVFEGIISGLNDNGLTPISYLVMLMKVDNEKVDIPYDRGNSENEISNKLLTFFRKNHDQVTINVGPAGMVVKMEELPAKLLAKGYLVDYDPDTKIMTITNRKTNEQCFTTNKPLGFYVALKTAEVFMRDLLARINLSETKVALSKHTLRDKRK